MAEVCKYCRSTEVQAMTDGYACLVCGRTTKYADPDRPGAPG